MLFIDNKDSVFCKWKHSVSWYLQRLNFCCSDRPDITALVDWAYYLPIYLLFCLHITSCELHTLMGRLRADWLNGRCSCMRPDTAVLRMSSQAQQQDGIGLVGRPQRGLHDAVLVYGICVCISKRFCCLLLKCPVNKMNIADFLFCVCVCIWSFKCVREGGGREGVGTEIKTIKSYFLIFFTFLLVLFDRCATKHPNG